MGGVYLISNMIWKEIEHPELNAGLVQKITARLETVLQSWKGTPYGLGQQCKGMAVDCVRLVCGVLDEPSDMLDPDLLLPQVLLFLPIQRGGLQ